MEEEEYEKMYRLESSYWWFKGKRKLLDYWIGTYYKNKKGLNILDAGCGTGINMNLLQKYGEVHGIDNSDRALVFCRKRGLKNLKKASVEKMPYKSDYFDIVTILDVLTSRHIKDDVGALNEINRILKKNGRVFITDSAMKCLWSRHDEAFHTKQRYSKKELREKMEKAGFAVEKASYFNNGLFLPVLISRKIGNLFGKGPKSDVDEINPFLNWLIYKYYSFEISMMKYLEYPVGVSLFAIGRKK